MTALSAVVFVTLVIIGAICTAHQAPGPLGFGQRDTVLHGVLAATYFAVLYWLIPDVLEGPDWVPRRATQTEPKTHGATQSQQSHTEGSSP